MVFWLGCTSGAAMIRVFFGLLFLPAYCSSILYL
jgi:hypothetical protein